MEIAVPTGIVEEFPCARTGKIVSSRAFQDILALSKRIPGMVGYAPEVLAKAFVPVIVESIQKHPTLWLPRFESRNGELFAIVEVPDLDSEFYRKKRWRARLVMRATGLETYRVNHVSDVPVFWLEELKNDELP